MGARIGGWGCGLDIERGVRGGGEGRGGVRGLGVRQGEGRGKRVGVRG